VAQAQSYIADGFGWVVDIDLEKFFNRVNCSSDGKQKWYYRWHKTDPLGRKRSRQNRKNKRRASLLAVRHQSSAALLSH